MRKPAVVATAMNRRQRAPSSLPFGWGAVTVLLVGAALTIIGIVMILYGFISFISGTVSSATSDSFSIGSFFSSFLGMMILMVIGAMFAGVGGWLVRLWWIFLLVGAVAGGGAADTVRGRGAVRGGALPRAVRGRGRREGVPRRPRRDRGPEDGRVSLDQADADRPRHRRGILLAEPGADH